MEIKIIKTSLEEIRAFRRLFLQENSFQFICNKCHDYNWSDDYLFITDDQKTGYGCVWGTDKREDRDTIFEFYIVPPFRKFSSLVFSEFCSVTGATLIECQTNDPLLLPMLYEFAENIRTEAILFEDHITTNLDHEGTVLRKKTEAEEDTVDLGYILEKEGETIASGGLMLNYNFPYADIYMEVQENFRGKGFGGLMVQELKKQAYLMGRVPSARCNINNNISKATLMKAGFKPCGYRVKGDIKSRSKA